MRITNLEDQGLEGLLCTDPVFDHVNRVLMLETFGEEIDDLIDDFEPIGIRAT